MLALTFLFVCLAFTYSPCICAMHAQTFLMCLLGKYVLSLCMIDACLYLAMHCCALLCSPCVFVWCACACSLLTRNGFNSRYSQKCLPRSTYRLRYVRVRIHTSSWYEFANACVYDTHMHPCAFTYPCTYPFATFVFRLLQILHRRHVSKATHQSHATKPHTEGMNPRATSLTNGSGSLPLLRVIRSSKNIPPVEAHIRAGHRSM